MRKTIAVCSTAHFLVDFACAYLLFSTLRDATHWAEILLVYNFCAFAVQMPLGVLADRLCRDGELAAFGAVLAALSYGLPGMPLLAAITAGLGNAAFHVGGGLEILSLSEGKAGPLGLFVAPGAVGLFFGTVLGRAAVLPALLCVLVLLAAAGMLAWIKVTRPADCREMAIPALKTVGWSLLLLLAVVALRSFVGMSLSFPWMGEGQWAWVLTLALAVGKAAGGYLADRFGFMRIAVLSLLLAAGLLFFDMAPVCGAIAMLCFNMTMPLTLWASARLLSQARGFAFGLLTFGLFLGFLPVAFGAPALSGEAAAALCAVSAALLLPALRKAVER